MPKVTLNTLINFVEGLTQELLIHPTLKVDVKVYREGRSLSQNAFQHVMYQEISKYLVKNGRKDWTPDVVKQNLKNKFLGWEDVEFIDVETGEVKVRQVLKGSAKLDKGDAYQYTTQILNWCEEIGLTIKIPVTSEHHKQMAEQNR